VGITREVEVVHPGVGSVSGVRSPAVDTRATTELGTGGVEIFRHGVSLRHDS
jgi:hypothetical protein